MAHQLHSAKFDWSHDSSDSVRDEEDELLEHQVKNKSGINIRVGSASPSQDELEAHQKHSAAPG